MSADASRAGAVLRRVAVALALALCLLGAGPAVAAAQAGPEPAPGAVAWAPCGPGLECARVPVPLDWEHPDGRTLSLAVIRRPASRPEHRIGSLFVNPGGPGDSGVGAVVEGGERLDALTGGRFDIVGWDVRGSVDSAPVLCFPGAAERLAFWGDTPLPGTDAEETAYLSLTGAFARRCGTENGDRLAHISSADTARDLDHLRGLVGDRQLTYVGQSAGTLIGQTYANLFPGRVRAMALDGLVDAVAATTGIEAALATSITDADQVFDAFLSECEAAGPDRCALAGEGPVAPRVLRLLERLRLGPLPAPGADPPGELTYAETLTVLKLLALASPAIWPEAARQLAAASRGDGSAIETTARLARSESFRRHLEANVALACADGPARTDAARWPGVVRRLEGISRVGGNVMGWLIGAPCASWPQRSADRYTGPWDAATPNPILLIGTRLDPNTPLVNAQRAERRLGNAVLLTHDGFGHLSTQDPSACVEQAVGRYLVGLVTPRRGTVCPSDRRPFDPAFGTPGP
jgi:pimeloyl-ACP methyl ester carboxylesterase